MQSAQMDAVWRKIEAELERRRKPRAWLGRLIDASDQAMNNWKVRGVPAKLHRAIAEAFGWTVDQLLNEDWTPEQHTNKGRLSLVVAQNLSQFKTDAAPHVEWGAIMDLENLPAIFWTAIPDDSMAPRAAAGRRICFDTGMTPRAGDGVLIADAAGAVYFRVYRAAAGGRWTAHATNPAFADLDSERDGLRVLAVLKAEEGRWS